MKRRNMKGLMAELETIDTPMMACIVETDKTLHLYNQVKHLNNATPGMCAPRVSEYLLSDELVHHVGHVGDHEDGHHGEG